MFRKIVVSVTFMVLLEGLELANVFLASGASCGGRRFFVHGPLEQIDCS